MRIKEEIKRLGFFWLPSSPERKIPGTLSISDGGDIKLELTQPLDASIQALFGYTDSLDQILGHVEKDGPVVVDRCYRMEKKRNVAHGGLVASDVIWARRVLTSFLYDEGADLRFNTFTFSVEGVDEWVGISGIEVDPQIENHALIISYNRPIDVSLNLENGMRLLITFAWTLPGFPSTKRAEVTQKTYFKLMSQDEKKQYELDEFISVAEKIAAFLCFVMDEIVCLERMSATSDNLHQDVEGDRTAPISVGIYYPSWPYSKNEPEVSPLNMLFGFEKIQSRAEKVINKWIENYEQIAPAFDLYFWAKTATLPSWNMQFLTLTQSLEAFHRRTSDEMHMDEAEFEEIRKTLVSKCPKEERNWFAQILNHANQLTLRNRIEKMTETFNHFMCGEKKPQLIDKIVKTRNYLTHHDPNSESEAATGADLQFLCSKMNALFRLRFLKLIGFDEEEIDTIVDKCPSLKGECNL